MAQAVKNALASAGDVGSGENWQPGLQLVRCYQEPILWAQFLYLLISRKVLNPSWWRLFIVTSRKLHETHRNLLEKYVLVCIYSPFTISHIYWPSPLSLWSSFSELFEVLFPGLQASFCLQWNLTPNCHICISLKVNSPVSTQHTKDSVMHSQSWQWVALVPASTYG